MSIQPATSGGAVFLSYASQDAAAVQRIAAALRAAGVEVWFDQNELGGGDVWDAKIRRQIAECALFVPVISEATQARLEGYFRIEWKLAAQRTHAMAEEKAFLLPVVIDGTRDAESKVPGEFRAVQWTRLPGGEVPAAFVARVKKLLGGSVVGPVAERAPDQRSGLQPSSEVGRRVPAAAWAGALAVIALGIGATFFATRKSESASPNAGAGTRPPTAEKTPATVVSEKSVAVLPFANLSGDKEQEYFSDGLTEEVLGALRRERDLTVPGNTSCFSFKGKNVAAAEIARSLNVSRLVEGSVQRVGSRVRIRVTLARPADNSSEELGTFTEELTDIFALQEKVARAVVAKLTRRTTTAPVAVLTKNPAAYDAYLRGRALLTRGLASVPAAIKQLEQAVALDPDFALAWVSLAEAKLLLYAGGRDRSPELAAATRSLIDRALELQPNFPEALVQRANWERHVKSDYLAAQRDLARAEALQPATAELRNIQAFAARDLGQWDEAFRFSREMVQLDPNNAEYLKGHAADIFWRKGHFAEADRLLARVEGLQGSYSSHRVTLRLIWRGPAAALGLLERAVPDSTDGKLRRIDLLLAMNRQPEARALAAETESDLMPVATDGLETSLQIHGSALSRLLSLGREEAARRLAEEISATTAKELERGNQAQSPRRLFIQAEIVLRHREVARAALEQWRRENKAVQNNYHRVHWGRNLAYLYAMLGMADEAIEILREYAASGLHMPDSLRYNPDFALIRNDPRFQELMQQQEAWAKAQPDPVDL